ncbi:hypothetical protein FACS1894186_6180 [Alphaproteobacteria bacterium]|nr:hypothetical protein FACS1894186_6180 [Alphaproteobacteria bacterium]
MEKQKLSLEQVWGVGRPLPCGVDALGAIERQENIAHNKRLNDAARNISRAMVDQLKRPFTNKR